MLEQFAKMRLRVPLCQPEHDIQTRDPRIVDLVAGDHWHDDVWRMKPQARCRNPCPAISQKKASKRHIRKRHSALSSQKQTSEGPLPLLPLRESIVEREMDGTTPLFREPMSIILNLVTVPGQPHPNRCDRGLGGQSRPGSLSLTDGSVERNPSPLFLPDSCVSTGGSQPCGTDSRLAMVTPNPSVLGVSVGI